MRRLVTAVIAAACFACPAGALNSEYKIGMLSCSLGEPSEAPAGEAVSRDRTREVLCTFQPQEGVQETYTGTAYGVSVSANEEATFYLGGQRSVGANWTSLANWSRLSPMTRVDSPSKAPFDWE
jgi:hypothetical protein